MQLHQLLRFVVNGLPIVIFDIAGIEICEVSDKSNIDINLLDYDILEITVGSCTRFNPQSALYITIQK